MSAVEKPELIRIAEAIPDGTPVDWEARSSAPPADELVLTQLRDLERVAAAHREVGSAPAAEDASSAFPEAGAGAAAARAPEPSLPAWGRLRILERIGGGAAAPGVPPPPTPPPPPGGPPPPLPPPPPP